MVSAGKIAETPQDTMCLQSEATLKNLHAVNGSSGQIKVK